MIKDYLKRALTFVKEIFTKNLYLKLFYLLLIVFLCYAPSFCQHTKITTPSQDAYELKELAQCIETEAELRHFEHKYHEMELAYRNRYDGAMAIKFRLMTQSIAEEAAARRDGFRQMEDAELKAEQILTSTLDDMDAAWQIDIQSKEEAYDSYCEILDDVVSCHMSMRAKILESGIYYERVAAAGYPEDMLDEHSAIVAEAEAIMEELAECQNRARHYNLAYRLQYGESFPKSLLLERYIAAFDGNYSRISKGVEYGDVEFIVELLGLVETEDEYNQVKTIKDKIYDAYMAEGTAGKGNATLYNDKLEKSMTEVEQRVKLSSMFEINKSAFDAAVKDKESIWDDFKAKEAVDAAETEALLEGLSFDSTSEVDFEYLDF